MAVPEVPVLKLPPAIVLRALDTDKKAGSFFLEGPLGCQDVLSFRFLSIKGTISVTYQRHSCMGNGYLLKYIKNSVEGIWDDTLVIYYRDGRLGSRESLTEPFFSACSQNLVRVIYIPPAASNEEVEAIVDLNLIGKNAVTRHKTATLSEALGCLGMAYLRQIHAEIGTLGLAQKIERELGCKDPELAKEPPKGTPVASTAKSAGKKTVIVFGDNDDEVFYDEE